MRIRKVLPILLAILLVVIFIAVIAAPHIFGKPVIRTDYLAQYNQLTKPENYDPEKNAQPLLEKAFEASVAKPDGLSWSGLHWLKDINDTDVEKLRQWVADNGDALDFVEQAAEKPYRWVRRQATDDAIFKIELDEAGPVKSLAWCLEARAQLAAYDGQPQKALADVIVLRKIGELYKGPFTLVEQLVGTAFCALSARLASMILTKTEVSEQMPADFQQQWQSQIEQNKELSLEIGEKIYGLDMTQRAFTDDGHGDGKVITSKLYNYQKDNILIAPVSYLRLLSLSITHPGRKETLTRFENLYRNLEQVSKKAPYQLKQAGTDPAKEIRKFTKGCYYLEMPAGSLDRVIALFHRQKADAEGLLTTVAILRYRLNHQKLPDSLQDIVTAGILEQVPLDIYSGKPLIYKPEGDNFKLYSVGPDFVDNGGVSSGGLDEKPGEDYVFWPVKSPGDSN